MAFLGWATRRVPPMASFGSSGQEHPGVICLTAVGTYTTCPPPPPARRPAARRVVPSAPRRAGILGPHHEPHTAAHDATHLSR